MCWWIGGGPRSAGRIELGDDAIALTATTPAGATDSVVFATLRSVRLEGRDLHVERDGAPAIRIGSLDAPGALRELAERLSGSIASR